MQSDKSVVIPTVKDDDSIIEVLPWIQPFIDVYNEYTTKNGDFFFFFFFEKTMKAYSKAVILSI